MKRHVYLLISVSCLSLGGVLSAQAGILSLETDLSSHTHNTHLVSQTKLLSLSQLSAQSEHRDTIGASRLLCPYLANAN